MILDHECVFFYFWKYMIQFTLDLYGPSQRRRHPAVVLNLLQVENPFLPILQPLFQHLIAADLVFPNFFFNICDCPSAQDYR